MTKENPEQLDTIVTALRTQRGLQVAYHGRNGLRSRTLLPLGLVVKAGRWYLAAQPPGGSPRTYRVSRIGSAELRRSEERRVGRGSETTLLTAVICEET